MEYMSYIRNTRYMRYMSVAAMGLASPIGLGCGLIGNQPAALADWQSASS